MQNMNNYSALIASGSFLTGMLKESVHTVEPKEHVVTHAKLAVAT
jgi:hypothetical protein